MKGKTVNGAYFIAYIIFMVSMLSAIFLKSNYPNHWAGLLAACFMCMSGGVMVGLSISLIASASEIIKHLKSLQD